MNIYKIKRFLEPCKIQKWMTFLFVLFSAFSAFFWIYSVEILKQITKQIELWNLDKVYSITYFFIWFIIVFHIFRWYWKDLFRIFKRNAKNFIQKKYIKEFVLFENNAYEKIWTGKLIALIERWIDAWSLLITDFFYFWWQILFSFIFSFYYIYKIIWVYTLIILMIVIILLFITKLINKKAIEARSKMIDYGNLYTKDLVKIIMSKFEILQNDKIDKEIKKLKYLTDKKSDWFKNRIFWLEINFWLNRLINSFLKVWAIFLVWIWVIKWVYDFSEFMAIIGIFTILDAQIWSAVNFYKDFTKNYVKVEKLYELYDDIKQIKWYNTWKRFKYIYWDFKIKNLNFSYPWKQIFKDFNLNIKWWKKTAIIWKSGSGKTTLIKLISWFLKPDSWDIIIDKQKLSDISLKSYYKHIWYLTQEPSIFDWTIIENLTYSAKKRFTKKQIKKALKMAEADFIFDFKDWIETEIGERGIRLSWWQRQRLAIAKIFIKDPEIIILDEPTSSLDSFSEEKVTKAINNLFKNRTVIVVAHRLQTVKKADEIIIMDNFKVIERWTHKKLLKSWKYYKKMVDLQSGFINE